MSAKEGKETPVANSCIDLHVHSNFSDGRLSPEDLAKRAFHNNVTALAITDHDTLQGGEEKALACRAAGIECVQGVEISRRHEGREAHILSLFADPESTAACYLLGLGEARAQRMQGMLEKLARLGINIGMNELGSNRGVVGRPHLARALVAKGIVKNVGEAFGRFLYDDGPVHIPKKRISVADGIDLAKKMGGVAVLAHPGVSKLIACLDELRSYGLEGVEVHHPKHGDETIATLLRYCRLHSLLVSGGSDFHAPGESPDIGSGRVPRDLLEPLRERAARNGLLLRNGA